MIQIFKLNVTHAQPIGLGKMKAVIYKDIDCLYNVGDTIIFQLVDDNGYIITENSWLHFFDTTIFKITHIHRDNDPCVLAQNLFILSIREINK